VKPFEPAQVVARVRELIERGAGIVSPLAAPRGVISPPAVPALRVEPAMPAVGVRGDTRRDEDAFDSYLSGIDDALARIDTRPARPLDVTSPPAPRALAVTLCPSAPGEESLEDFFARLNDAVSGSPLPAQETAAPTRTGLTRGGGDDGVRGAAAALKGGAIELIPSLDSLASGGYPRPAPGDPGWDWSEVVAPDVEALVERIVDRLRPELEASLRRAIYDELGKVTTMSSNARRRLA